MKAYLGVTGILFALVGVAHLARTQEVLTHVADDPWFVVGYTALTVLAIGLAGWAWRLYRALAVASRPASMIRSVSCPPRRSVHCR